MRRPRLPLLVALATAVLFACTTDTLIGPKDVAVLVIEPDTVVMPVGDTVLLEGVATDSRGVKYIGEKISWSSSNPSVVSITADGHLISVAVGTSTVTAEAGGKSASAQVTVTPPATIATNVDSLAFGAVARGPLPATQKIIVTNGSPGQLVGLDAGPPVYTGPDTGWLSIASSSSTTAPDTIILAAATDTFPVGTYTATVPITATKATNTPKNIKVTLTLSAGAPSAVAKVAGDSQTAVVQAAVPLAPSVSVKDAFGNVIAGVSVTFSTNAGNGVLTGATAITNASGIATLGTWTLDTIAKTDTLTATVGALTPVEFTAVAIPGAANQIIKTGGDAQSAAAGATLPAAPSVAVHDKFGNPVSGATVTFAATAVNGSVTGATPATNALGAATVGSWTIGTIAKTDTLTASVSGVLSPAVFTATGAAGAATAMAKSAGGTTGTVNANVAPAPAVLVSDQFGNPVAGVLVTFAATAANGTVTGGSVSTNASGVATVGSFKLATATRTDTLTATSGVLPAVNFVVTSTPDVPNAATKNAGDGQTAAAGSTLPINPSVLVKDQFGNPVSSVPVTFAVASGGGAVTGGAATTNAAGLATVGSWQLGNTTGANSLTATVGALPLLTFTATSIAGVAKNIARVSPAAQSDTIGATAGTDSVLVTDQLGNPVSGVTVTWGAGGAGSLTPLGATTSASGIAKATRTLGTVPGTVTDTAIAIGLTGSPVTFTVTTSAGHATTLAKGAGDPQTDTVGATLPTAYTDTVKDRAGNPVAGVTVSWAAVGGSITLSSITGANGVATATRILGTTAGTQTATGSVSGLAGSPTNFSATATHGNAKTMAIVAGSNSQSATAGTAVSTPPSVKVADQFANPVSGVTVTFALGAGGARNGAITGTAPATNASGVAALGTWTLGNAAGPDTVNATAAGLTGSPAIFVDTSKTGSASAIAAAGGNAQTDSVKGALPRLDSVLVTDAALNPVSGVTVTWTVTKGGGSITPSSITNANGIATAQWILGDTAGAQTATAASGILTGSPVTFTATATAGAPMSLTKNGGDAQTVAAGTAVPTPLSVLVKDQFNNPVAGTTVTFAAIGITNGGLTGATPATNASGVATLGSWTVGNTAKTDSVTATVGAQSVTFTATVTAGTAKNIARLGAASQSDTIGATLAALDSVKVTDQFGNPVAGTAVTWASGGAGTLTPTSGNTNAQGIATATRVLGTTAGAATDTAKATGLTGSPVTFGVTTNAGLGATLIKGAGDAQTDTVGATLAIAYTDTVKDRAGNFVSGVTVTWGVTGGGSITPSSITGVNGVATATRVLGTVAGSQGATATVSGLAGSPVSFTATANHGTAKILAAATGTNGQAATVGTAVATTPGAKVTDQFGNPIQGIAVSFALGAGGARNGSITGTTPTTNASGIASLGTWTLGSFAGPDTVVATSAGLTGSPFTFIDFGNSGTATTMALAGGNGQTDTVLAPLPKLDSVKVTDGVNPVSGVTVSWAVTSGGGSIPATSITDGTGVAVAQWTLGATAGAQTSTATVGGLIGSPVTFSATATHGNAKTIALSTGGGQSATVNTAVTSPSVLVEDAHGNVVPAVSVTFASSARSGTVTGGSQSTNASGLATVGTWTLGTTAGPDTLTATSAGLTGSPVLILATGTGGSATNIARLGSASQSDTIGATLAVPDSVKVTDGFGNPISGVTVTWAAGSGGSLTPSGTTNAAGIATATRVLGTLAGTFTDTAKAVGLTGSPITFTATASAGHAASIALNGGDAQTDTADATLPTAYTVLIADRAGNPVSGTTVTWGTTGGGSITPSSISGANGLASATRVLGPNAGTQDATATTAGLAGSPITFGATVTHGAATTMAEVAGTNGQSGTAGAPIGTLPAMKVTDQFGNVVPGVTVTFALGSGGARNGSITGPNPATNGSGVATLGTWTLGNTAGPDTVIASSAGLTGTGHVFVDIGAAGSAATIALAGGNGQTDTVKSILPRLDSVLVTDALANPVSGVTVNWAVTSGSIPASSITNANGIAVAQWTLGDTAKVQTATATAGGLAGSPVTFSATATHGNLAVIAGNGGSGQTATVNTTVSLAPSAVVTDAYDNPISGVTITFAVTGGGGSVGGTNPATTDGSGVAAIGSWKLGTAAGTNTLTATATGLVGGGNPVTFTATGVAGVGASMIASGGTSNTATVGNSVPAPPQVTVTDAFGNPVQGFGVTFAPASLASGSVPPGTPLTDASGVATVPSWTLGSAAKIDTLIASGGGLGPVNFLATATAGPAANLAKSAGDAQTDTIGAKLQAMKVLVTDAGGNPVPGVTVNWVITSGTGTLTPAASSITDASGLAADTLTLGTTTGAVTVQASSGALTPVTFGATANPGNPVSMVSNGGNGQSATVNTAVATAPSVKVTDRAGNGVPSVGVTFSVASTNGSVIGGGATTASTGIAAVGSWTLDSIASHANTLTATSGGLAGSPVTFTATGVAGPVSNAKSTLGSSNASITACSTSCTTGGGTASTITVTELDSFGNPISGGFVLFQSTGSTNTFTPSSGTTNNSGVLTSTFNSTTAEGKTVSVTGGVTQTQGITVTPAAVDVGQSTVAVTSGSMTACSTGCVVGSTAVTVTVTVKDAFGNVRPGSAVAISANGTGNTLGTANGTTPASGQWTSTYNSTVAATHIVSATANTLGITQTQNVVVNAAAAASIAVNAGNNQTARVNTVLPTNVSVIVKDAFGNLKSGVAVTFAVATGGGSATGTSTSTGVTGIATVGSWTIQAGVAASGTGTHSNTITATAAGLVGGGNPVTFTAQGIYTLSGDVQPIWTANCTSCHGSGGISPNLTSGNSRANTVGVASVCTTGTRIIAGNAASSVLYLRMTGGSCGAMPPSGILAAGTTNIVRDWINNGAQNN